MIVFLFDQESGAYIRPCRLGVGDLDPRDPGTVLVPGDCTTVEPPRCGEPLWPFWVNGQWVVRELVDIPEPKPAEDPTDYWSNWCAS